MSCKVYPESLPQRVRQEPKFGAEVQIYDLLRSRMGIGWTVFYDVAWLGLTAPSDSPRDGQVDFIVAHPSKGVLLIEVKGGRIHFDASRRQWISTDRNGQQHDIDPFAQVRASKYALLHKLKSLSALRDRWIDLAHAVCFPGSQRPRTAATPDALPDIIIGADDLDSIADRIEEILRFSNGNRPVEAGDLLVRQLTELLGRSIELPNPLAIQLREDDQEIIRLTESQARALNLLSRVRRAAIGGAAGSGKTFLATEKARRLAHEGFQTLLVCSSPRLADHLSSVCAYVANLDVLSIGQLASRWSGRAAAGSSEGQQAATVVFDAMSSANERPYDAIVVDEGQDLSDAWWLALESCLRDGRDSVFYVFHDTHQSLNPTRGILPERMVEVSLEDNVRNTQAICRALIRHYEGSVSIIARGPAGRSIEAIAYEDDDRLALTLRKVLQRLLVTERLRPGDVVVLTPRPVVASAIAGLRLPSGTTVSSVINAGASTEEVELASIDEFKGLERKVAIIVELDDRLPNDKTLRHALCYVAFSRPRHHLVVLGRPHVLSSLGVQLGS